MNRLIFGLFGLLLAGCASKNEPQQPVNYDYTSREYRENGEWEYRGRQSRWDDVTRRNDYFHPNYYKDPRWPNAGRN